MADAIHPASLSVEEAARILAASGSKHASAGLIREHIEAGAPLNSDGTINLIHYTAWILREGYDRGA